MKEYPILFDAESMRANMAGTKTQTRRLTSLREINETPDQWHWLHNAIDGRFGFVDDDRHQTSVCCPYGVPGDRIWGRETWGVYRLHVDGGGREYPNVLYQADSSTRLVLHDDVWKYDADPIRWRRSMFMPRWACRFVAEVVAVRVERVQDISEADCHAEGLGFAPTLPHPRAWYRDRWDAINGNRAPWVSNPWVWAIEYKQVQP